jgi:PAS domain S-box-containing protein
MNAELQRARRQLADIFESMTDAFFALDNDWCFTYVNRQAEKVLFRTCEELLGKNVWEEFAPAVDSTFYREYRRAKAENIPVAFEEFYPPLNTWFEVRAYPSAEGLGIYFHNINERRAAQEAMQRQTEELAQSNADLEHFAYAAAHDLQEPLRMVAIFSQLLEKKYGPKLDEEGRRYIAHAAGGAKRMEQLVHDLLTYTRTTSRGAVSRTSADTERILKDVLADMRSTIERAGARIHFAELPPVLMEPAHLGQLFQNLIGTAIKYRSEDVPRIHISAARCGEMARFSIEDNGIGIEPQYAEQVFGLFKRLHTNDEYEGTGIGLAICQKIVARYGGRIWLESKLGSGSAFFFTVPA